MVVELNMEQTNNTNLALFFEVVEWFNTTYCHIFQNLFNNPPPYCC